MVGREHGMAPYLLRNPFLTCQGKVLRCGCIIYSVNFVFFYKKINKYEIKNSTVTLSDTLERFDLTRTTSAPVERVMWHAGGGGPIYDH